MLRLLGIGALGNMLSPAANHLNKETSKGHFIRILDRSPHNKQREEIRRAWQAHGASIVNSYKELLHSHDFDGIVICAGKNGDDAPILSQLIHLISQHFPMNNRPFILHCSTVSIDFVNAAFVACDKNHIEYVNYPLTGGVKGAQTATMLILASGREKVFKQLAPVLSCLGQPKYFGNEIDAAAKVKLIGHLMVFNGLIGISSAVALQTHSLPLSMLTQEEFFDFLNQGAGGTRQWDVALKQVINHQNWQAGFLLHHAAIDAIYTADLLIRYNMTSLTVHPILQLASAFSFLLNTNNKQTATQIVLKALLEMPAELEKFISACEDRNSRIFLENIIRSLPEELASKVKLNITVDEILGKTST